MTDETHDARKTGPATDFRAGFVAICGLPNAGKSTLLNALIGERLAIATRKPQTTRRRMLGHSLTSEHSQIIFVDTPGILEPRYALQTAMMHTVDAEHRRCRSAALCRRRALTRDRARGRRGRRAQAAGRRRQQGRPARTASSRACRRSSELRAISAAGRVLRRLGVARRGLAALRRTSPSGCRPGRPLYPPDELTEHPERFFVAELDARGDLRALPRRGALQRRGGDGGIPRAPDGQKDFIAATIFVETRVAEGDPHRPRRASDSRSRAAGARRDRGLARPPGLSRAARRGAAALAQGPAGPAPPRLLGRPRGHGAGTAADRPPLDSAPGIAEPLAPPHRVSPVRGRCTLAPGRAAFSRSRR